MNRAYRSIWSESLGTYVAAAECTKSSGKSVSSSRSASKMPLRSGGANPFALEQRIVFDGALPVVLVDAHVADEPVLPSGRVDLSSGSGTVVVTSAVLPPVATVGSLTQSNSTEELMVGSVDTAPKASVNEVLSGSADLPLQSELLVSSTLASDSDVEPALDAAPSLTTGLDEVSTQANDVSGTALEVVAGEDSSLELAGGLDSDDVLASSSVRTEVIFIDAVAEGVAEFLESRSGEIVYLSADVDGVEQIAAALQGRTDIDAIHILSHGTSGSIQLGSSSLSAISIVEEQADDMAVISAALSVDADILIYGCDVGSGAAGVDFVSALALATGADVAVSMDATGSESLGGNWVLEAQQGQIDTTSLAVTAWSGLLAQNNTGAWTLANGTGSSTVATNTTAGVVTTLSFSGFTNSASISLATGSATLNN